VRALDYRTGKVIWNHELGDGESIAGILTTAGHLLFTADNSGNLLALDPATGNTLWHLNIGARLVASPMTYQLDGRQYLLMPVQDTLYAFALPEKAASSAKNPQLISFAGVLSAIWLHLKGNVNHAICRWNSNLGRSRRWRGFTNQDVCAYRRQSGTHG